MNPPCRRAIRLLLAFLPGVVLPCLAPSLVRGDELTRQVQEELRKRNLYFGDVDGRYTAQIAAALRRYQQRKGFALSGQVDETTLRSLSLLTPAAATIESPGATATTTTLPVVSPPSPWPDLPVLHSDQGREHPSVSDGEAGSIDPPPFPTPAPPTGWIARVGRKFGPFPTAAPPTTATTQRWPDDAAVRSFVEEYLRTGESNVPETQQDFYAGRVDYFNEGVVDARFIAKDTARYNKRWPERHFTLLDPVEVAVSPDGNPDRAAVNFHCRFAVQGPGKPASGKTGKKVTGETSNTYVVERSGPDSMRIVSIKEERVRGK